MQQTVVVALPIDIHRAAVRIGEETVILNIGAIMIEGHHRRRALHSQMQIPNESSNSRGEFKRV